MTSGDYVPTMSAEYEGKIDRGSDGRSKTVPVLPRPLKNLRSRQRAENLTGDPTGMTDVSFDNGMWWTGSSHDSTHILAAEVAARESIRQAIDAAWYD